MSPPGRETRYFSIDHDKILQDRLQETCQWIFQNENYINWRERTSSSFLWIHGDAGLGKTFLASSVIEALSQEATTDQLPQVIYFYCRYSDEQKNTLISVLRSLLLQLFESKSNNLVILNELDRLRKATILDHATAESLPLLIQALSDTAAQFPILRCVIDGVDELAEPGELVRLLFELQKTLETVFSVVIVSRKEDTITKAMCNTRDFVMLPIVVQDTQADVSKYVRGRLATAGPMYAENPTLYEKIHAILESSDGVLFMWARLMLDELENKYFVEDAEEVLQQGPVGLGVLYDRTLANLDLQNVYTRRIFTLLLATPQQLKVMELAAALELDMEIGKTRKKKIMIGRINELIKSCCGTLVECDGGNVSFKHFSIKQHFQNARGLRELFGFAQSHREAMKICLKYLQLDSIPSVFTVTGFRTGDPFTPQTPTSFEFLPLATTNWYLHFRLSLPVQQPSAVKEVSSFLDSEHSVTWLMCHFAFAGPDLYQQRSHHVVEMLKCWLNTSQASEYQYESQTEFIRTWRSAFVQLSREWGSMLCGRPLEIYRITSSLFKDERAKALLRRMADVCKIDHLGNRPTYKHEFHIEDDRFPILHTSSNVVFTCGRNDIDCRSGDTGFVASRLKYSVALPGFEGDFPLRAIFSPNNTELLIALQPTKHQPRGSSKKIRAYVLSITICPDSLPENAFLTIKVEATYTKNQMLESFGLVRPPMRSYNSWLMRSRMRPSEQCTHYYNHCLFRSMKRSSPLQPLTRLQKGLPKAPAWLLHEPVVSLDFCGDGSRLFKTTMNGFLEVYGIDDAIILKRQLEGQSKIVAISFSGRCVALLRNSDLDIYDSQEDLITRLCLRSSSNGEEQWAEFSRDGLKLLIFSAPSCQPLCGKGSWREPSSENEVPARDLVVWQTEKN